MDSNFNSVSDMETKALEFAKNGKYKEGKLYGDGTASQKIISVLKNVSSIKIQKQITY